MAILDTNRPIAPRAGLRTAFGAVFGSVAAWNDRRVTRAALTRLSDRELDDIGLMRGDIADIADGTFRG
jgi:uncharacterized protein YjiS (DUF1127 family)